ncbi:response regulator receiver protein [Caballeronia grimmiae]|uniref:Response regulator receiver protein n=2 Tax=Caballeronia grimmiae TaxID=1071679 RepID=A0A069P3H1_9BURK|nr:response regulator receiver protein [Caballeronia grimmiae]
MTGPRRQPMIEDTRLTFPFLVSVIDDDESVRAATSSLLRSLGWEVHLYPSAESFLESGHFDQVACIISDVQMPGMTGLQLQQRLRELGLALPIIFITAFASDAVRRQALDGGALCFLGKPVDGAVVSECLSTLQRTFDPGAQ